MKILILSFYFRPDLCAGSFRTSALITELQKLKGVELEVITTLPNRYASFSVEAPKEEFTDNLRIHRVELPNHSSGMLDQIKAFGTFYAEAIKLTKSNQYDMVFATSSRLFTAFLGARIAKRKRIPLYLDIRDIFVDTIKDVLNKKIVWLIKPFLTLVERYTFKSATHINLVSQGFHDYFASRYPRPSYTFYTNGIDEQFLQKLVHERIDSSIITILYAGNIGEGQGLHNIVPQLARLLGENYIIRIIGDGGRKQQLKSSCENLQNVLLESPVNREVLLTEYSKADILFLHLNDYDAFKKVLPSKVFEYAAMGKPILAGVSGYAAEFIQTEIENAAVFAPTDAQVAANETKNLVLKDTDRSVFVQKYTRTNIMQKMAHNVIKVVSKND